MKIKKEITSLSNIFIMKDSDEKSQQSPLQGFLVDLFSPEIIDCFHCFQQLPHDVTEIFMASEDIITTRNALSDLSVYLISPSALTTALPIMSELPFVTITCMEEDFTYVETIIEKFRFKPITLSTAKGADVILNDDFNMFSIDNLLLNQIINYNESKMCSISFDSLLKKEVREAKFVSLKLPSRNHAVSSPNERLLLSLGFSLNSSKNITPSPDAKNYINAILQSSDTILENSFSPKNINKSDLVVFAPSLYRHMYNINSHEWNQILRKCKNKVGKEFIKNGMIKIPNYSGHNIRVDKGSNPFEDPIVQSMLMIRQMELALSAIAAGMVGLSNSSPAIRLPNSINFHNAQLKELEKLSINSGAKGIEIFNRKFKQYISEIKNNIGIELIDYISNNSKSIALCTDVPIEWIDFKTIPLMFSHEISKIHTTPGNLFLAQSALPVIISVKKEELLDILIIRSFNEKDPIKNILAEAVFHFEKIDKKLNITLVDIDNREELIEVLKQFKGHIVIFDCHGNHGGNESHGWLQVGDEKVDTWSLSSDVKVPPIVILSACLTAAVSGSHASVANGFMASGALSVIGTFLPVEPIRASIFVGRILYRISGFLDALYKMKCPSITWRMFISGFFRMSYSTDILRAFEEDFNLITNDDYVEIHGLVNHHINTFKDDWFSILIEKTSQKSNKPIDELYTLVSEKLPIVETMYYNQIGKPENIFIELFQEKTN